VLRETLHLDTATHVESVIAELRNKSHQSGLSPLISDTLLREVRELILELVEQGKRIAAVGSQMEVTRDLSGDDYSIRIVFREGVRRSVFAKLLDALRGR
jgi:hypothetical protein